MAEPKLPTMRYLRPASSDVLPMRIEGHENVERDREPLEAEEERQQVPRRDEEDHAAARRREERVVLADVIAAAVTERDQHRQEAEPGDEHLGQRGEAIARHRFGDHQALVR